MKELIMGFHVVSLYGTQEPALKPPFQVLLMCVAIVWGQEGTREIFCFTKE